MAPQNRKVAPRQQVGEQISPLVEDGFRVVAGEDGAEAQIMDMPIVFGAFGNREKRRRTIEEAGPAC